MSVNAKDARTMRGLKTEATRQANRRGHRLWLGPRHDDGRFTCTTCTGCDCTVILCADDNPPVRGVPLRHACEDVQHVHRHPLAAPA
jgi:hypothetical protein